MPVFHPDSKALKIARSVKAFLNPEGASAPDEGRGDPEQELPPTAQGFDNREFWETRYTTNLELGSGAGSRGEFLEYKRGLLCQVIEEFRPRSILDVGCGDIEVTKDLPFSGEYTGIDFSPSIVARNRALRPAWNFIAGDFLEIAKREPLKADLVICFDVLIHQHDYGTYRAFAQKLIDAARRVAVINGFESLPRRGRVSKNCAYHEPITHTLTELSGWRTKTIGSYRNTRIVQIDK